MSKPLDTQVGGNHYKDLAIQPVEYIFKNNIGYFEGCVIKYVTRWKSKGGVQDLEKAKHFLELLIDLQEQYAKDGMLDLVQQELAELSVVEQAEPEANTVTLTLPRALKKPQDEMWFVDSEGYMKSGYGKCVLTEAFNRRVFFGSEEDAKAWFDAMQYSRK